MKAEVAKPGVSKVYLCSCNAEGVAIDTDEEFVCLSMWSRGCGPLCRSLRDRIRWAWKCLTSDSYYVDEVLMTHETAAELAQGLTEAAAHSKKYENVHRQLVDGKVITLSDPIPTN